MFARRTVLVGTADFAVILETAMFTAYLTRPILDDHINLAYILVEA